MASKGQPIQDDGKVGPSGLIQEEKDKTEKDEARGSSGSPLQQKV